MGRHNAKLSSLFLLAVTSGFLASAAYAASAPPAAASGLTSSEALFDSFKKTAKPAARPDWSGIWERDPKTVLAFDTVNNFQSYKRMNMPPLNPPYEDQYKKTLENSRLGREWDHLSLCLPPGFPRVVAAPLSIEFAMSPAIVWIMHEFGNETRRIYTDGRGHYSDDEAIPLWDGDSIGFWDGDTLVVHTNHVRAMPMGYQRSGAPQSEKLSAVERYRKIDADRIEGRMWIFDEEVLSEPWQLPPYYFTRVKVPGLRVEHYACAESSAVVEREDGSTFIPLPGDKEYLDPNQLLKPQR